MMLANVSDNTIPYHVSYLDLDESRLHMAERLGADVTIKVEKHQTPEQLAVMVEEMLGEQPNKALECSGAESSIKMAVHV